MAIIKRLASGLVGPIPVSRGQALATSERLSAATSLVSSLEHLSRRRQLRKGGLNDWAVQRGMMLDSAPATRKALDLVGNEKATTALHVARVAASAGLLAPGNGRWRGAASLFLALSNTALYRRHLIGGDGSDQVSGVVQTANSVARLSRSPEVQDAAMWYVALQSNLSYLVSGWVKLLGPSWRDGSALGGVMRTRTYGHRGLWELTRKYPVPARYLTHGVLALECLFPLAYARGGALTRPVIAGAAAFHLANGYAMGLGRFATAFTSMHPMVAYTSAPKDHPTVLGRDDRMLGAALAMAACAVGGVAALAAARRARALDPLPNSREVTTRHGNRLHYNARLTAARSSPVLVLCPGLITTPEHFSWITDTLLADNQYDLLWYGRAGYGPSRRHAAGMYTLQESVDDLLDLIEQAVPAGRDVVLVGHSLGAELCRRTAGELGTRLRGLVYLDSSHPAELRRSEKQQETARAVAGDIRYFLVNLRLGLGALIQQPDWVKSLPEHYRGRMMAQYADSRLWAASLREWRAVEREFPLFTGELPSIDAPALVISAQRTVDRDPEHLLLHKELADAHRGSGKLVRTMVLEGSDHDSMLTRAVHGVRLAGLIAGFVTDSAEGEPAQDSLDASTSSPATPPAAPHTKEQR